MNLRGASDISRPGRRLGLVLLCAALLGACTGPGPVRVDVPAAPGTVFDFQDMRPAEQRSDQRSFDAGGERYLLGERDLEPPPAALFRAWFARKLSAQLLLRTLVLDSFIVWIPASIASRATPVEVEIAGSIGGHAFVGRARSSAGNATRADVNATIVDALNDSVRQAARLLDASR